MRYAVLSVAMFLATALLSLATTTRAGTLDAAKPSEVVHLRTVGTVCPDGGGVLDLRTYADGHTERPYALPPKRILVVRRIDFEAQPGIGTAAIVGLEIAGNVVATKSGVGGPSFGVFDGSFEFDPGLLVSDTSTMCIRMQNSASVFATLTGFLTKNK